MGTVYELLSEAVGTLNDAVTHKRRVDTGACERVEALCQQVAGTQDGTAKCAAVILHPSTCMVASLHSLLDSDRYPSSSLCFSLL